MIEHHHNNTLNAELATAMDEHRPRDGPQLCRTHHRHPGRLTDHPGPTPLQTPTILGVAGSNRATARQVEAEDGAQGHSGTVLGARDPISTTNWQREKDRKAHTRSGALPRPHIERRVNVKDAHRTTLNAPRLRLSVKQ